MLGINALMKSKNFIKFYLCDSEFIRDKAVCQNNIHSIFDVIFILNKS